MTRILLRRALAVLALPALAACEGASAARPAVLAGTYAGGSLSLVIPEGQASPFAVHGTVTDARGTSEVRGTAVYQHPAISFELVRVSQGTESVFGVSGTVSESRREITSAGLTLKQR
jgi:hypothetical protein